MSKKNYVVYIQQCSRIQHSRTSKKNYKVLSPALLFDLKTLFFITPLFSLYFFSPETILQMIYNYMGFFFFKK